MIDPLALPGFRTRLAALRRRPPAPHLFARRLIECGHESADAFVAARRARDDEVADGKRRAGRVVVLMPVRHLRFPEQGAGVFVQRDDVRVIGDHEEPIAGNGGAAIDAAGGVADEAFRARTLVVPDFPARSRVERIALVGGGDVHHAFGDDRRHLQTVRIAQAVHPLRRERRGVALVDL